MKTTSMRHAATNRPATMTNRPRPEAHARYQASRDDSALQEAARIQRAMSTDMPPMPEPVEREAWSDWWADVRGWVLCGLFVGTVLAFVTHVAGVWGA